MTPAADSVAVSASLFLGSPDAGFLSAGPFGLLADVGFGGYVAWWKALIFTILFLVWVKVLTWIDKDALAARMPREAINGGGFGLLVLAVILAFVLPLFVVAAAVFVGLMAVGIGGYLAWRGQVVGLADIPDEIAAYFKNLFKSKKVRPHEAKEETTETGAVVLLDKAGNAPPTPEEQDPARPGYDAAHRVLLDPLYKGAERIVLAPAGERYGTKYRIDGFDYAGNGVDTPAAAGAVDLLKRLAGLDVEERRKHQKGVMKARTALGASELEVNTSGTRTGESVVIEVDRKTRYRSRVTALGMTPQQRDSVTDMIALSEGIVLAAAPPGGGLDAMLYGFVQEHDAFVQHIITLERKPERELEGTTQNTLTSNEPGEEAKQVSWIVDQLPDVLLLDSIETREAAGHVLRLTGEENKRVYVGLRAGDTADALARWKQLVGDDKQAVSRLRGVVASRVLRKLCDACKIAYEPGDAAMAKMGIPKGKVKVLYRARTEPMLDQRGNPVTCTFCGGLGYHGRTGVFEVLPVDDPARGTLRKDHSGQTVRNLIKNARLTTLNESAIRAVVAGKTDLQEVQRVLNPAGPSKGTGGSGKPARKPKPSSSPASGPAPGAASGPAGGTNPTGKQTASA